VDDDVPNVLVGSPLEPIARFGRWLEPQQAYVWTRYVVLRLLGVVYVFAFLGILFQGIPLLGAHGLTPVAAYVARLREGGIGFLDNPSLFLLDPSDTALRVWAVVGLALSIALLAGYANLPSLLVLWFLYGSYERIGQTWFAFGWEIQILETTLVCACLAHPWDPRPLRAPPPPLLAILLARWLVFRIFLGSGLIKIRGDACWRQLTCLDSHFETQPIPNPLSPLFHGLPHVVLAAGVVFNHVVELVLPWLAFGPRRARLVAVACMIAFQGMLILSGNLAFLNWLTLVPVLALLDDGAIAWLIRRPAPAPQPAGRGHRIWVACFAALVAVKSIPVIENLVGPHQAMNRSYDRLELVNTYGAFGSVGPIRHELVIEGTRDPDPDTARWSAYELPCKPGDLARRPCVLGPYHRRFDWLIWFAAMDDEPRDPWLFHFLVKLLEGDPTVRELVAVDPFDGAPPTFVRVRRFVYHLQPYGAAAWWARDSEELWMKPFSLATPGVHETMARFGWTD
jgi:hypothetical protein